MTTHRPWYPIRVNGRLTMRRHNRMIELSWGHWSGRAVYVGPPVTDKPYWAAVMPDRRFEPLPPKKVKSWRDTPNGELIDTPKAWLERNGWGDEPNAWRPLPNEQWPDALPEPLDITRSADGVMARIDQVTFSAAEAAAEMEAERLWRRDRRDDGQAVAVDAWWRDGMLITYSDPGSITERECEGRVLRALYWLGRGGETLRPCTNSPLASMVADTISSDHMPSTSDLPRLVRMPHETDERLFQAMNWISEMLLRKRTAPRWLQLLVHMTADHKIIMSELADKMHMSWTNADAMKKKALRTLTQIANTGTPRKCKMLEEVRERRRAYAQNIGY